MITAAMHLFAEQGFRRTTVGQIEEAAGLTARGGALYKHFAGKRAILEAALDQQARDVERQRQVTELLPLDDLGAELTVVGRYLLAELAQYREVTAVVEQDRAELPEIATRFWRETAAPGYVLGAQVLDRQLNRDRGLGWDAEALSAIVVGAIVNYRRSRWTYGHVPLDVDEERLVHTLVRLLVTAAGERPSP